MAGIFDWRSYLLTLLSILFLVELSLGDLTQAYCSNQNTGTADFQANFTFNSNGYCGDKCRAKFAFAVVQGQECWCSNYIPAAQRSTSSCNDKCPGYPYENCGSVDDGLFGYITLNLSPSGTATGSGSSSVAKSGTSSSTITTSGIVGPTITQEEATPTKSTPVTSVQVVTISGSVITQTVTSMPKAGTDKLDQKPKLSSSAIIGAVVASVIAVLLIVIAVVGLLFWRRRRQNPQFRHEVTSPSTSPFSNRRASVHSKAGLLGARSSVQAMESLETQNPNSEQRSSRLMVFDQRLNPRAFMQHDDGSHTSVSTMQDNRDYTRTLNVRNPDPTQD